ncbi:MAG: HEPN domain-containing protein [candidate division WOR-3 bacterium]
MSSKFKPSEEWFRQADYDLATAQVMFETGRYIYTVFMCHLSIEKALKGLFAKRLKKDPPKIHNLNYFCEKLRLDLPADLREFVDKLNDLSIPTRYPDELKRLLKDYKKESTEMVLIRTKELLVCLKKMV